MPNSNVAISPSLVLYLVFVCVMPLMTTTQIRRQRGTLDLSRMAAFTILLGTKLEISWGRRHRQLPNVRDYICAAAMCRSASYIGLMSGETDSGEWDGWRKRKRAGTTAGKVW